LALTVLRDINDTIKALLKSHIPELSGEEAIVFESPGDMEQPVTPKLSVFLYLITENPYLRNAEPLPVNLDKMRHAPLYLELQYLFTPYAQNKETEMIIMESLIRTLYDYAILSGSQLQGNLAGSGHDPLKITPKTLSLDELNKLWSVFPNKAYKLSVSYLVTPVIIQSDIVKDITRVVEKKTVYQRMDL
jgi:hypothetical protein